MALLVPERLAQPAGGLSGLAPPVIAHTGGCLGHSLVIVGLQLTLTSHQCNAFAWEYPVHLHGTQ